MSDPCVTVVVGSFVADGITPDSNGIVWTVQRIDGWFDSTAARVATADHLPFGEVVTLVRENARAIALTLVAHALPLVDLTTLPLGAALCFTAMDSIEVPFACVYAPATLEVVDPVLDLFAAVRRVGPIQKRILGESVAVRFLIPLLAEDPYRWDGGPGVGSSYD
jgi:hypothetical protein